jgi:hypothetical protein
VSLLADLIPVLMRASAVRLASDDRPLGRGEMLGLARLLVIGELLLAARPEDDPPPPGNAWARAEARAARDLELVRASRQAIP